MIERVAKRPVAEERYPATERSDTVVLVEALDVHHLGTVVSRRARWI